MKPAPETGRRSPGKAGEDTGDAAVSWAASVCMARQGNRCVDALEDAPMYCPFCKNEETRVVDSRLADEGQAIRRRRSCNECGRRFTTVESAVLAVVKRNGVTEPFSREKVMKGVRRACQGRQVDDDKHETRSGSRGFGPRQQVCRIPSNEVGLAILGPLRDLDEVAYLRFASVYRSFDSVDDFQREIDDLRSARTQS